MGSCKSTFLDSHPRIVFVRDRPVVRVGCSLGRYTRVVFAGYVPVASQSPYPIIVYSVANYRPHLSQFWEICNFRGPNLVTFYLSMYLILNEEHFTF